MRPVSRTLPRHWNASDGNEWTVPLGSGFTKTTVFNRRPMHIGVTFDHKVERPDGTAGQQLRFSVTLLNPEARSRQMITHEHGAGSLPQPGAGECPRPGMVWIPGRTYQMGSEKHYPEERPVHRVSVDGFWIDRFPVTNEVFARFVEATGHVTFAEIPPNAAEYPGALPEMLYAGSLVFVKPGGPVDRRNMRNWWHFVQGRRLAPSARAGQFDRRPRASPGRARGVRRRGSVRGVGRQVAADRGGVGVRRPRRTRGRCLRVGRRASCPGDQLMANTWQGEFPWQNTDRDGYERHLAGRRVSARTATGSTT